MIGLHLYKFCHIFFAKPFQSCFICLFSLFCIFLHIFLKILRLFNVIKIAVNLFMQWKECLTNGQMLARSDHYIFFSQFAWNSFLARCLQTFRAYYFYAIFFANDSAECCGCPFFYIFLRHYKHCRYFKYSKDSRYAVFWSRKFSTKAI